jgi:alpha-amylase/alpha-mannosidase (GH57 family)
MTEVKKYICVHGHFYQPPRENAWLEAIESQDSAAPFHDWNARINHECYATNGSSRILNKQNEIVRIVNNYARISFNIGPTLLAWMEHAAPLTYRKILEADRASMHRFGGHGSAIAQVYNHIILPLATTQDRITQIRWGIADFEHRFGRKPEGMWLAETAVDLESLDLLARHGIRFTILAPSQCARVRPIATENDPEAPLWHDTPRASVDPTQPYLVRTSEDHAIAVFFYDGPMARAVAFEGLLNDGGNFARRLLGGFRPNHRAAQLVHIATDGESYGHHHRHGDMALAYALQYIENNSDASLTNYGEFLEKFPPGYEAEIYPQSSWSCSHGIERWRSDCGCNSGSQPSFDQRWRGPLRDALDWLRDRIRPAAKQYAAKIFKDEDHARNAYIDVILDRGEQSLQQFFQAQALHPLSPEERIHALKLMEMERHIQLMYTSCGWFFDDISGIETMQVIAYAGRVIQLASELFGSAASEIEAEFLQRLALAQSNVPAYKNGAEIYRKQVLTHRVRLKEVAAHYAVISLFEPQPQETSLFCYNVKRISSETLTSGRGRFSYGQVEVCSQITLECDELEFAVLHLGDQNLSAAVRHAAAENKSSFEKFGSEIHQAMERADLPEVMRVFAREFGSAGYSLLSLFRDEQQRILRILLDTTLLDMERTLRAIYEDHASLLHYLSLIEMPKPQALMLAAEFSVNADLRLALAADPIDSAQVRTLLTVAHSDQVRLDSTPLAYAASQRMLLAIQTLEQEKDAKSLEAALDVINVLRELPLEVDLWEAQNKWNAMMRAAPRTGTSLQRWALGFRELGYKMGIDVANLAVED